MKIEDILIKDLKFAEYNPRQLKKKQMDDIKKSLSEFGFVDPVIVNQNPDRLNVIVGGHQRVKCWASLGHTTVPAVFVNLSEKKERELNIRLNKNVGEWDFDILANEFDLEQLVEWGFDEFELKIDKEKPKKDLSDKIQAKFIIEIECDSELKQEELFYKLTGDGLKCRILTL